MLTCEIEVTQLRSAHFLAETHLTTIFELNDMQSFLRRFK